MRGDLSFKGDIGVKVTRGSGHSGWRRIMVLIRDWLRLGR